MARTIYYLSKQKSWIEDNKDALREKLENLFRHGNNSEPIATHGNTRIFSLRLNKKNRVLYTRFTTANGPVLVLLESIEHNYKDAVFLKPEVLKSLDQYISEKASTVARLPLASINQHKEDSGETKYSSLQCYGPKFIALDSTQQDVLEQPLPLVVNGAAGSGKSCLAFGFFQRQLAADPTQKILYTTRSKTLVNEMKRLWEQSLDFVENTVEFCSYDELLIKHAPTLRNKTKVGFLDFTQWYNAQNKIRLANWGSKTASTAYREIMTGIVRETNDKNPVLSVYQSYCEVNHKIDFALYQSDKAIKTYHLVVVDEAQDLSSAQCDFLIKSSIAGNIYFCLDTNQGSSRVLSPTDLLLQQLKQQKLNPTLCKLKTSYRCADAVTKTANLFLAMRNFLLGGIEDRHENSQIEAKEDARRGSVRLVSQAKDIHDNLLNSTQFAIVVKNYNAKLQAKNQFSTPLIFTIDEIKGLEYPHVFLFNLFNDSSLAKIDRQLPRDGNYHLLNELLSANRSKRRQDQDPDEVVAIRNLFNDLFCACTRAVDSLWVFQSTDPRSQTPRQLMACLTNFVTEMSKTNAADDVQIAETYSVPISTQEDWINQASLLIEKNYLDQARDILRSKLKLSVAHQASADEMKMMLRQDKSIEVTSSPDEKATQIDAALPLAMEVVANSTPKKSVVLPPHKKEDEKKYIENLLGSFNEENVQHLLQHPGAVTLLDSIYEGKPLIAHITIKLDRLELLIKVYSALKEKRKRVKKMTQQAHNKFLIRLLEKLSTDSFSVTLYYLGLFIADDLLLLLDKISESAIDLNIDMPKALCRLSSNEHPVENYSLLYLLVEQMKADYQLKEDSWLMSEPVIREITIQSFYARLSQTGSGVLLDDYAENVNNLSVFFLLCRNFNGVSYLKYIFKKNAELFNALTSDYFFKEVLIVKSPVPTSAFLSLYNLRDGRIPIEIARIRPGKDPLRIAMLGKIASMNIQAAMNLMSTASSNYVQAALVFDICIHGVTIVSDLNYIYHNLLLIMLPSIAVSVQGLLNLYILTKKRDNFYYKASKVMLFLTDLAFIASWQKYDWATGLMFLAYLVANVSQDAKSTELAIMPMMLRFAISFEYVLMLIIEHKVDMNKAGIITLNLVCTFAIVHFFAIVSRPYYSHGDNPPIATASDNVSGEEPLTPALRS